MNVESFLTTHASTDLKRVIVHGIEHAKANLRRVYLADIVVTLLESEAVKAQVTPKVLDKSRLTLAEQLVKLDGCREPDKSGRFDFRLDLLAGPAVEFAKACGASNVTPLVFLATCISSEQLADAQSQQTRERLKAAQLTLDVLMPKRTAASAKVMSRYIFQSLGYGFDLTAMARDGFWPSCPVVGMERQLYQLAKMISYGSYSVAVVGEPGVGKSALVYGLAYYIARRDGSIIRSELNDYTIVSIPKVHLLSGTGPRGELDKRIDALIQFFGENRTVIPFFDEFHTLLSQEEATTKAIANALKESMAVGALRCIGVSTHQEYARYIATDEALNRRFTKVSIPEPDAETTISIIRNSRDNIIDGRAKELGVTIPDEAIRTAVKITTRYQRNNRQPAKSIDLLKNVVATVAYDMGRAGAERATAVSTRDVAKEFSEISGIPVDYLDDQRDEFYARLAADLAGKVYGQPQAIEEVTNWLSLQARGWVNSKRPRGRFLFLGPPGVGKTELGLQLAEQVMRDSGALVVKNLGEYKGAGARSRFMGADPGYVGFGQTSTIYDRVFMHPYSVIVLDEIEKADPELADVLLSVLDGQAEDSRGRIVDFSQCIFILTSNALHEGMVGRRSDIEVRRGLTAKGGIWTPPLVDRLDRIVVFSPLSDEVLLGILEQMIVNLRQQASAGLPPGLDGEEARLQILNDAKALTGGAASARGLERALLIYLQRAGVAT